MDINQNILCDKCNTPMVQDTICSRGSLDYYSGTNSLPRTSVATSVTIYPHDSRIVQVSGETGHKPFVDPIVIKKPIKIRNYTCPSCGHMKQVRIKNT